MDMIERVAAAIDAALEAAGGWDDGCSDSNVIARAAIEAMREPTNPVLRAMNDYIYEGWASTAEGQAHIAREAWQSSIDAALLSDQPKADIAESVSGKDD